MKKPNLLYIFADQLRYSSCGYTGDKKAMTPNIDMLSKESINLCNAVSGHPVCAPYRASLFTGKYTTSTGMVINEIRMNTNHKCIGHVLSEAGYNTAYIGKWHLYANEWGNHYDPKNSYIPPGPDRLGFDQFFAAYNFHHEYYGENAYYHLNSPEKIFVDGYEPDVQTGLAIEQMEEYSKSGNPFAMFLSLGTPHDPWVPENVPAEYLEKFKDIKFELPLNYKPDNDPYADDWAKLSDSERDELTEWMRIYYAMTANLDDNIGRILKAVDQLNLENDTIVIFTSDHGELFGAHGRRAKNIFYEEAVRVPYLIRWPGYTSPGTSSDICFNTVDIMPTLLTMMGLQIPSGVEGTDMSGSILSNRENSASFPKKEAEEYALMMGTGKTADYGDGYEWRAIRGKRYTYAIYLADKTEFLFDNINDPYQMENLIGVANYAPVLQELRENLRRKMAAVGDEFKPCSYYMENKIKDRIIVK